MADEPKLLTMEEIRERVQSQGVPLAYYNYCRVAASFFDVRLFFGQGSIDPKGEQHFEEQLCLTMSPEFAKTLRDNLVTSVEKYEKVFGEIRKAPSPEKAAVTAAKEGKAKAKS